MNDNVYNPRGDGLTRKEWIIRWVSLVLSFVGLIWTIVYFSAYPTLAVWIIPFVGIFIPSIIVNTAYLIYWEILHTRRNQLDATNIRVVKMKYVGQVNQAYIDTAVDLRAVSIEEDEE